MNKSILLILSIMAMSWSTSGANATCAQSQHAASRATGLVLEITYDKESTPIYLSVPDPNPDSDPKANWFWFESFRRIASWQPPTGFVPVQAVKFLARSAGDSVQVEVSLYLGARFHEKEVPVATQLLRENEKTTISKLTEFGIEPIEIKLTRVRRSLPPLPTAVSHAKSIEVIGLEPIQSALPSYKVRLKNLSGKSILALGVESLVNGEKMAISMPQGKEGEPLITAGAIYELYLPGARETQRSQSQEGRPPYSPSGQQIVITAAIFEDNSYEGNAETAATFRAFQLGRKLQIARLRVMLQAAVEDAESNISVALDTLRAQASSLGADVEMSEMEKLLKDFPTLSQSKKNSLKGSIEVSMNGEKTDLLGELQEFEKSRLRSSDRQDVQKWLKAHQEKYEKWLSRL